MLLVRNCKTAFTIMTQLSHKPLIVTQKCLLLLHWNCLDFPALKGVHQLKFVCMRTSISVTQLFSQSLWANKLLTQD